MAQQNNDSSELMAQAMSALLAAQEAQRDKRRAARKARQERDAAEGSDRKSYSMHLALSAKDYETIRRYCGEYEPGRSFNYVCTRFILEGIDRATTAGDGGE